MIIGGVLFATAFLIGGLASYKNITSSKGPLERRYVTRMCAMSWSLVVSMLAFAYFLNPPWLYAVISAYFVITPVLFYRWTTTHQLIREKERRDAESSRG